MKILTLLIATLSLSVLDCAAQLMVKQQLQLTGGTNADRQITNTGNPAGQDHLVNAGAIQNNSLVFSSDNGTADAYTATLNPPVSSYSEGLAVYFLASNANTGPSTLNVNGLGAALIKKSAGTDLSANDISAGQLIAVIFDGTNFQMTSSSGSLPKMSTTQRNSIALPITEGFLIFNSTSKCYDAYVNAGWNTMSCP